MDYVIFELTLTSVAILTSALMVGSCIDAVRESLFGDR